MIKTFDHAVIYNGVLYPANTPIEVKEAKAVTEETTATETPKTTAKKGGAKNDNKGND